MIKLTDLKKQYLSIQKEINEAIQKVIDSTDFIQGKWVTKFEEDFKSVHPVKHVIGCSSGTTALQAILNCWKDHFSYVVTTPLTFFATLEAIIHSRAKPIFIDIDPDTYNMDLSKLQGYPLYLTLATERYTILPVHLYGNPCIQNENFNVNVFEDCCQAHLATYKDIYVGNFGLAGAFSFFPGKNIGAYGDAGCIVTNDDWTNNIVRQLINHGRGSDKYIHKSVGFNYRMDDIQAAILSVKIKYIKKWTELRITHAERYKNNFKGNTLIKLQKVEKDCKHVYHIFSIEVNNRDEVMKVCKDNGIDTGIYYPTPLHLQPALEYLWHKKGDFPIAERVCERIMSLPMYPELTNDEIDFISEIILRSAK